MLLSYLLQNEVDSDIVWCIFSRLNLPNVFYLTLIVYLHYLVKHNIRLLQVNVWQLGVVSAFLYI